MCTFHSLGFAILGEAEGRRPNLSKLAEDMRLFRRTIARFIDDAATDPAYRSNLVYFFATLLFVPKPPEDFASRDAYPQFVRSIELRTLKDELVKGFGELAIANFLALNSIPYEYEKPYPIDTSDPRRRAYRPDFTLTRDDLYIEHFGLDRQGNTAPGVDHDAYLAGIRWKRALHKQQGTTLVETFSWQPFEGKLNNVLHQALAAQGVAMVPADTQALLDELREAARSAGSPSWSAHSRGSTRHPISSSSSLRHAPARQAMEAEPKPFLPCIGRFASATIALSLIRARLTSKI